MTDKVRVITQLIRFKNLWYRYKLNVCCSKDEVPPAVFEYCIYLQLIGYEILDYM